MKRLAWWVVGVSLLFGVGGVLPVGALDAVPVGPSQPPKVDGPYTIIGYSFQGKNLRYVQIENTSKLPASLDGWRLTTVWSGGSWSFQGTLSGRVAPGGKIIIADSQAVSGATLTFVNEVSLPADPKLASITLAAPSGSNLNDTTVGISTTTATPSVATSPPTYFFSRNISGSTGAYLSTFSAIVPDKFFHLQVDPLYERPVATPLQIVEIYPRASACAPSSDSQLCRDYVKLYNPTNAAINLGAFRLRSGTYGQSATSTNTTDLPQALLPPRSYAAFSLGLVDSGAWAWLEDAYGEAMYDSTFVGYPSAGSREGMAWSYNEMSGQWQWTRFPTPYDTPNQFSGSGTVNQCSELRLSEIAANHSPQFIEVYNASTEAIDISGCQLQTNRSQTVTYSFPDNTTLAAGAIRTVAISDTPLSLTKTMSGTVYILSSDSSVEVDSRSYENLDSNTSLALVGGRWLQTFAVTPGATNEYEEYPPCQAGYIRNIETGRCNKIIVKADPTRCAANQYRNPETNRCRLLPTATSLLTPCKENQYRNPETNRCKAIATAASALKPCAANQERNSETNRCRKVTSTMPVADFAVTKDTANTSGATLGWVAFASVGGLLVMYGVWEWRSEIRKFFDAILRVVQRKS